MVIPEAADSKTNNYFSSKNIKEMRPVPIYYEILCTDHSNEEFGKCREPAVILLVIGVSYQETMTFSIEPKRDFSEGTSFIC